MRVALVGNPNAGKTTLFNALTGLHHRVGNYPGVTVERVEGTVRLGDRDATLIDLPGTYSLAAHSPDELIAVDVLLGPIDAIVAIVNAAALERGLYLVSQLAELERPMVVALNMIDLAEGEGVKIDAARLAGRLGVPVVPMRADRGIGLAELKAAILDARTTSDRPQFAFREQIESLQAYLRERSGRDVGFAEAFRTLVDRDGAAEERFARTIADGFPARLDEARRGIGDERPPAAIEALTRYAWIRERLDGVVRPERPVRTASDRIDAVLTHRIAGTLVLAAMLMLVFQSIYTLAEPLMGGIEAALASLAGWVGPMVPEGAWRSLVEDGVIGGVGGVVVFLPQILILFFFIALLEDCGYMARAAFLVDRIFGKLGLSGRSMIPLMSSFACAIPGIMAARTIPNSRQRLATILVAPLMSCSARLPIYVILIGAFVPATPWLQGTVLFGMHAVGALTAIGVLWVLKKTLLRGAPAPFVMELPAYQWPRWRAVARRLWDRGRAFVVRAGTIIFAVTAIVWALTYFPRPESIHADYEARRAADPGADLDAEEAGAYLRQSWLGRAGRVIEPVVRPLGWDWKLGMATLASFPAREVIVSTLGTIYNVGDANEESDDLRTALRNEPGYTLPTALSVMVFFALCAQCGATLAVIKRETNSWRWPVVAFAYMTALAYVGALATYQLGRLIL